MSTYRELIYMCKDLLKNKGDDSYYTNEHFLFLLDKFRAVLLEQKYSKTNTEIDSANTQVLCIEVEYKPLVKNLICSGASLVSKEQIPDTIITFPRVYPYSYFIDTEITFVSINRFKYVGNNRWLNNIIYATELNHYLYLKSTNPNYKYLKMVNLQGIFSDTKQAYELSCTSANSSCDILDKEYPIEEGLQSALIELVVKEISTGLYKPEDVKNNAKDDLSDLHTFIAKNVKSDLQKQIDG